MPDPQDLISVRDTTPPFISRQVESSRLFFLDLEPGETGFHVGFGGFERCRTDYRIDRSGLPWFCLEFVISGEGELLLNGIRHDLRAGSFFIYGPSIPHRIETLGEKPLLKYFVGFAGSDAAAFLKGYDIEPGFSSRCLKVEPIRRSFENLIERGTRKSRLARPLCEAITRQLLLMCCDDALEAVNTETTAYTTYLRAKDFIEQHFLQVTTLEGIAAACKLDGPYLCRLFGRFHDESPYQFLVRLRMEHAASLLLEKNPSVRDVAQSLGYTDPFHFSRVFKSVHHVPPSRFRQPN